MTLLRQEMMELLGLPGLDGDGEVESEWRGMKELRRERKTHLKGTQRDDKLVWH